MSEIRIGKPYITKEGSTAIIQSDIVENGKEMKLFCQVYEEYEQYLCDERSDAFVVITLPLAIRKGYDIYCEAPVTEALLHNINTILIPHLVMGDSRLHPIKVVAPVDNTPIGGEAVGTGISLGVDSMYTIMKYLDPDSVYKDMQITHFMIANNSVDLIKHNEDSIYGWEEKNKASIERYEEAANYFNKPLLKMYSNLSSYLARYYDHYIVHTYKTLAHVLFLKKLWKTYYFANSLPFTYFNLKDNSSKDTYTTELLIMHTLNVPDFSVYSSGPINRIQKTIELADYEPARKWLHPCWNQEKMNCSKPYCDKCLRGLLALDYYDKLDAMSEVFDVDYYRKNHFDFLYRLVERKDDVLLCELYEMMQIKYPEEMKKAKNKFAADHTPISHAKYDELAHTYYLVLKMLTTDGIKEKILNFFLNKGIKTLYFSGGTNFGKTIRKIISDQIRCVDKSTSIKIYECDAAFNALLNVTNIQRNTEALKREGAKMVFTVRDLEVLCNDSVEFEYKECKAKGETIVGVIFDASSSTNRFLGMKQLYDIAKNKLNNADYVPSESDLSLAGCGIVCKLPKNSASMYQQYPLDILFSKNANRPTVPASTTKVMTAIIGLDYISDLKESVTLTADDIQDGSGNFFSSGDVMSYEDLIYGMMLSSSNTCAMAYAHNVGKKILEDDSVSFSDCVSTFISEMNKKASILGMSNNTIFNSPSGFSRTNKSTAEDMLRCVIAACSYDVLLKIWGKKTYTITVKGSNPRDVVLKTTVTNDVLETEYYILGGKTGCLICGDWVANALVLVSEIK